jgi:hypothetical protein
LKEKQKEALLPLGIDFFGTRVYILSIRFSANDSMTSSDIIKAPNCSLRFIFRLIVNYPTSFGLLFLFPKNRRLAVAGREMLPRKLFKKTA